MVISYLKGIIMTVDQEIRKEQKEYMSRMTKKEKFFYLASYYKWYVIGIIVLIVFSIIIISDVIKGMRPTYLYAVLSNTYLMNDISDEGIEEDFIRYTGLDTDKYQLSFDMSLSFKDDEADSLTLSSQEKIMALFAGKQIDVFIAPERVMERYLSTDLFQDPREVLGPEEISKLEDMGYKLYYCKYSETLEAEEWDPSTMEDYDICLGINVSNSKYLKTVGSVGAFPEKYGDPIFAFSTVASKEGLEHGIELLNMITKE